jgi:DNA-binding NtrC family response regulator
MKSALVLEKDTATREKTVGLLKWMGFVTAPVRTAEEALNIAHSISFKLIITYTSTHPNDRRSLIGELKRVAPKAAIILVRENDHVQSWAQQRQIFGVSSVVMRPPTAEDLRRVVEFGIDGDGSQPCPVPIESERRKSKLDLSMIDRKPIL